MVGAMLRSSQFFLLFMICGMALSAQPNAESKTSPQQDTINKYLGVAWKLARTYPNRSLDILSQIDSINTTLETPFKEDVVFYYYGVFYKNLNQFEKSEEYFNRYQAYHQERNHVWRVASVNMAKSNLFSDMGQYEKSSKEAMDALKNYESIKDTAGIINASNKLGYILSEIKNYSEGLKYTKNSIRLSKLFDAKRDEANAYTNTALIFEKQMLFDSALYYHRRAYDLGDKVGDEYAKFNQSYNMASTFQAIQNLDSAAFYAERAINNSNQLSIPALAAAAKRLMGDLKLAQGNTTEALAILESITTEEMQKLGIRDQVQNYAALTQAYKAKGDFKKAFSSLEKLKLLNDSLVGENSRNKINELEIAYQSEKKQQQIALLDLENENAKLQISKKNRTLFVVTIGLVLISILSLVLFVLIRKYLKQKRVLAKALAEKDVLLREIHHRVKNNLQLVSSLLTLQGQSIDDKLALKAINEGKSRVRSMALIHQDLYQNENITSVSAQTYLSKLCNELFQTYNIKEEQIQLKTAIQDVYVDVDTLIPLGLILNELVTNSLKYAFPDDRKGQIEILLKEENNQLVVQVKDNGVGYKPDEVRSNSFGSVLIGSLVQQLDGEIETVIENGTNISLKLKEYQISKPK